MIVEAMARVGPQRHRNVCIYIYIYIWRNTKTFACVEDLPCSRLLPMIVTES